MSNSVITNDEMRCIPRHKLRELYDLDDLHKLGIYFGEENESDTYTDREDESNEK